MSVLAGLLLAVLAVFVYAVACEVRDARRWREEHRRICDARRRLLDGLGS